MNVRSGLPTIAWALTILIAASIVLMVAGREGGSAFPSLTSAKPSGLAVFAQVLRETGLTVEQSLDRDPDLDEHDLAVAVALDEDIDDAESWDAVNDADPTWQPLLRHAKSGGTLVILELQSDFEEESRRTPAEGAPVWTMDGTGGTKRVSVSSARQGFEGYSKSFQTASPWFVRDQDGADLPLVVYHRLGKGRLVVVRSGIGMTNRFIDRVDNAGVFAGLFFALASGQRRLVFAESTFGNVRERSLTADLGPYVEAARWQALLLAAVVAYSLGRRFGLPETSVRRQRGAREMLDALGDTMLRARRTDLALKLLNDHSDQVIRRRLGLSTEASVKDRNARLPEGLVRALEDAQHAQRLNIGGNEAFRIARRLMTEIGRFESATKASGFRSP